MQHNPIVFLIRMQKQRKANGGPNQAKHISLPKRGVFIDAYLGKGLESSMIMSPADYQVIGGRILA